MATGYLKTYHGSQNQGAFKKDFEGFGSPLLCFVSSIKRENSELTNKSRKITMECYTPDLTGSLRFQSYHSLLLNLGFLSPFLRCTTMPACQPKAEIVQGKAGDKSVRVAECSLLTQLRDLYRDGILQSPSLNLYLSLWCKSVLSKNVGLALKWGKFKRGVDKENFK